MIPPISIIVPALNEADNLDQLLPDLARRWPWAEVVVVDGGSLDATARVLGRFPGVRRLSTAPGRARQMNAGARAARATSSSSSMPIRGCPREPSARWRPPSTMPGWWEGASMSASTAPAPCFE